MAIVKVLYDQMAEAVLAMGGCAVNGGPYRQYNIVDGVDKVIPWTCTFPAAAGRKPCYGVLLLREKIMRQGIRCPASYRRE